jgi:phosphoribosylformimino-5-aminoimidazole carboxamide ribotide isomerase
MLIIPAIDIKDGNCVRLLQGDPERETVYSRDPVEMAKRFQEAGAKLIHVVDLDGAFDGTPVNSDIVTTIARSISVPIEIGGGIRTAETVRMYAESGIRRIIVGTAILEESFLPLIDRFRDVLVAGVDAKNSMVATHGWKKVSGVKALDVIRDIIGRGIREVIYTDIATDGMLSGPNVNAISEILAEIQHIRLIASGGISSMDDLEELSRLEESGLTGCITGKAIYDGRINLREAVSRFG